MVRTAWLAFTTLLLMGMLSGPAAAAIPADQRQALIDLYIATGGDGWTTNTGWKIPPLHTDGFALPGTEGGWFGVTVGDDVVTVVEFMGNNLSGTLPASIGSLTSLEVLSLNDNLLTGPLPSTLGNLSALRELALNGNAFSGALPASLGGLSQLRSLWLEYNQLTGTLPSELGNCASLTGLAMEHNQLTGTIPDTYAGLMNLQIFKGSYNQFSGSIPRWLGSLADLRTLGLNFNAFTGTIPPELGGLTELELLELQGNQLSGAIPPELGSLSSLQVLDLSENRLTGTLPAALGALGALETLQLHQNRLSGVLPAELGGLASLRILTLYENELTGPLPSSFQNLALLQVLALANNRLTGFLPSWLGNLTGLESLYLDVNLLSGTLPPELGNLVNLHELVLTNNQLTGEIPAALGNLAHLETLSLSVNRLSGTLPPQLGNLGELRSLALGDNRLTGPLPAELGNLTKLEHLDAEFNQLSGPIPESLGNLSQLQALTLAGNALSGPLPQGLGDLANLTILTLRGNALAGEVPAALTGLAKLEISDDGRLDYNALTASDPAVRAFLDLKFGAGWSTTQTVTPGFFQAESTAAGGAVLAWTPIPFQAETGGYEIWRLAPVKAPSGAGLEAWVLEAATADKSVSSLPVALKRNQANRFRIRAVTEAHPGNSGTLGSEFSAELVVNPPQTTAVGVECFADASRTGAVYPGSASQVLPASALTLRIAPDAFPSASPADPMLVRVNLPAKSLLSQTLATGTLETASPVPAEDERVLDLAVSEYALGSGGKPEAVPGATLDGIGPHAAQLLRYVAGENYFLLRFNEGTAAWAPRNGGAFLGVTLGVGGGVWPATGASNWGPEGVGAQAATLLCADLRGFTFDLAHPGFIVSVLTQHQSGGAPGPAPVGPDPHVGLFEKSGEGAGAQSVYSLGGSLKDTVLADVDRDGLEDLVAVAEGDNAVYWSLGQPGGGFAGLQVCGLSGDAPSAVAAADVTGDGKPDLLVGEASGVLAVYPWESVFDTWKKQRSAAATARRRLRVDTAPTVLATADVDGDGKKDSVSVSAAGSALAVVRGDAFTEEQVYATLAGPESLAVGDFNADGKPDLAAACRAGNGVSVFYNDGTGAFTRADLTGLGAEPTDVDAGDLNRDGRDDLAVAVKGTKQLVAVRALEGNTFDAAGAQRIDLAHTPSSVRLGNFDGLNGPDALVGYADDPALSLYVTDVSGQLGFSKAMTEMVGGILTDLSGNPLNVGVSTLVTLGGGTQAGGVYGKDGLVQTLPQGTNGAVYPRSAQTSFSVVNTGSQPAQVLFELLEDGHAQALSAGLLTLGAKGQSAMYLRDAVGSGADQPGRWVRSFASTPSVKGFYLGTAPSGDDMDGVETPGPWDVLTELAFPVVRTGSGYTRLTLVNPGREAASVVLTRHGGDGTALQVIRRTIAGWGRLEMDASALFPGIGEGDWVRVTTDRGLTGSSVFGTNGSNAAALEALPGGVKAGVLYSPHVACGDFGVAYFTELTLVSTGPEEAWPDVVLHDDAGTELKRVPVNVAARGKAKLDVAALMGLTGPSTGYLEIDPKGVAGLTGCVTFGESGPAGRFVTSLPLQGLGHSTYLLGHIANGAVGGWTFYTGVAVLEPDSRARTRLTVKAVGPDGVTLASRELVLERPSEACPECRQRGIFLLGNLLPELPGMFGGYLLLEPETVSRGLLVFELFGDYAGRFLSAVPAVPLD